MTGTVEIPGPYGSRDEAHADTEDIRAAGTRYAARALRLERLVAALRIGHAPVGAYDLQVLEWLADHAANEAVQSLGGMLLRAFQAGRREPERRDAAVYVRGTLTCNVPACPCPGDDLDTPRRTTPLLIAASLERHLAGYGIRLDGISTVGRGLLEQPAAPEWEQQLLEEIAAATDEGGA